MSDGEFGRRLKYLRERDQVTMTRLASTTTMDKDRLRELEAGKAAPTPWERQRIAECFNVAQEYFTTPANPAAPSKGAGKRQGLDFSEFKYFKDAGAPSAYDSGEAGNASTTIRVSDGNPPVAPDLFDDSDSVEQQPAAKGAKGAAGGGGPGAKSGEYVDPFASFRAAGPAGGPARPRPAEPAEPVSERRGKGGKSMRSKKAPTPPVPPESLTMGKAPGSRFAHTRGVTDETTDAAPSEEPPSRGFRAVTAPPELQAEPPRAAPAPETQRRTAPKAAPPPPPPPAPPPERGLNAEAEALLDATFGGGAANLGASHAAAPRAPAQPARPAQPSGTARYAPLPPEALARAAQEREAAATGTIDPKAAALEALVYVKALTEILLARGLVTGEELAKALRRARGD